MKIRLIPVLTLLCGIYGCGNDEDISIPRIEGLSLYWDHEIFGEGGRRVRLEFYSLNGFDNEHELQFSYAIHGQSISVNLVKSIDKGKCQYYPMPSIDPGDKLECHAKGGFFIPENRLSTGTYSLNLITPYFTSTSELVIDDEKISLNIPPNENFFSSIREVYPIPENLLFGSVFYSGETNNQHAANFFEDLMNSGLTAATVPNFPYRHLSVDELGNAIERHWEPDNHLIGFVYNMNQDFRDIFETAKEHFKKSSLNIYLFSSNGDQGLMSQADGISVVFPE